jgi:hypothetical protein
MENMEQGYGEQKKTDDHDDNDDTPHYQYEAEGLYSAAVLTFELLSLPASQYHIHAEEESGTITSQRTLPSTKCCLL